MVVTEKERRKLRGGERTAGGGQRMEVTTEESTVPVWKNVLKFSHTTTTDSFNFLLVLCEFYIMHPNPIYLPLPSYSPSTLVTFPQTAGEKIPLWKL